MKNLPKRSTSWKVDVDGEHTTALFEPSQNASSKTVLILAHGAGGHMEHRNTAMLAALLREQGAHIVRFNFLYREQGKGGPDRMPKLRACYQAVIENVQQKLQPDQLLVGGQSMGGRVGSMLAAEGLQCSGTVLFAYPLHPAGKAEQLRDAHLPQIECPVLQINGTRDNLCRKELMEQVRKKLPATWTLHWLEGADHGFHVPRRTGRSQDDVSAEIGRVFRDWMSSSF